MLLGRRVLVHRQSVEVVPTIVLVRDLPSFVEAVGHWRADLQFPVLLDDGSSRSREDIGRFVRAFEPERVVLYSSAGEIPEEPAERRRLVESALARVFGSGAEPTPTLSLVARWAETGHVPAGVVVADDEDDAWASALVLAAGRGQPIVWVRRPVKGRVSNGMPHEAAARLVEQIEAGCDRVGLPWRESGDAIDAVTLCLNTPAKLRASFGEREFFALTDLVGRHGALGVGRLQPSARWAWAGQIAGDAASCVYQAMSSLFYEPESAWLFDGYEPGPPWDSFDMTRTSGMLKSAGIGVSIVDQPRGSLDDWLLASARAVSADLVMVNSKGRPRDFELVSGRGAARDAPMLASPAVVSFVHSFSASAPASRDTVAGRWRERGAIAYVGSVHEPFLQAFVPTPAVAGRLLSGVPLGAAVRPDVAGALWKITVLGDPLLTFAKPRGRSERPIPFTAIMTNAELLAATNRGDYAGAVSVLVMTGDDARAVALADAVLADEPDSFDANLAEAVAHAAFREANTRVLAAAVRTMGPARSEAVGAADAIWLHAEPLLVSGVPAGLADVLAATLREGVVVRDALKLASALGRSGDRDRANAVLAAAERLVDDADDVARLRAARR